MRLPKDIEPNSSASSAFEEGYRDGYGGRFYDQFESRAKSTEVALLINNFKQLSSIYRRGWREGSAKRNNLKGGL